MEPAIVPILSLLMLLGFQEPERPLGSVPGVSATAPDADRDGVADPDDICPRTPPGLPVAPTGCPLDNDADGVSDGFDRCPETSAGALEVDENGCSAKDRKTERSHRYLLKVT